MKKNALLLVLFVIFSFLFTTLCAAGLINYKRRVRNILRSQKEGDARPSLAKWMQELPRVRNAFERRYDINRDGKLQTAEVKIMLRYIVSQIELKGGYILNTDVLIEYDKNKDGIITREEGEFITKHLNF